MGRTLLFLQILLLVVAFASAGSQVEVPGGGKAYTSVISCDLGLHSTHASTGDESALYIAPPPQLPLLRHVPVFPGVSAETVRTLVSTPYARAPPSSLPV